VYTEKAKSNENNAWCRRLYAIRPGNIEAQRSVAACVRHNVDGLIDWNAIWPILRQ